MARNAYKLGLSIALTGVEEIHGAYELQAVQMAVEEAVAEGLPFDLSLVYYDDAANFQLAEEVAGKLAADPEVVGVIGCQGSNATLGGAPVYYKNRLAAMTFTGSNVKASQLGYDTFFRIIANDDVHADKLCAFSVNELKAKKVALVTDETSFGRGLIDLMEAAYKKAGLDVVARVELHAAGDDVSEQVKTVVDANPDLIFLGGMEPECNWMAINFRKAGLMTPLLGTDAVKPSKYLTTPGYDAPGPYQSNVCVDITLDPRAKAFAERYQKKSNSLYTVYTLEAYDAAKVMIDAMKACGETVTREGVLKNLKTMEFDCNLGKVSFLENGEMKDPQISFYTFDNQTDLRPY